MNIKNENITIKPIQNGYLVGYSYSKLIRPEAEENYNRYEYLTEQSTFRTWTEVVDFIKTKELSVPAIEDNG